MTFEPNRIGRSPCQFPTVAHTEPENRPAGSNHVFMDLHVEWVQWKGGCGMRANACWNPVEFGDWRRAVEGARIVEIRRLTMDA